MNYSDYQERIKEFAVYPRIGNNLSYPVLGLISEFGDELLIALSNTESDNNNEAFDKARKEAGDCYWYLGTIYNEIDEDWESVLLNNQKFCVDSYADISAIDEVTVLCILATLFGMLSGYAAKADRDNNGKLLEKHRQKFIDVLLSLETILEYLIEQHIGLFDTLEDNISKLQSRKERNVLHGDGDSR